MKKPEENKSAEQAPRQEEILSVKPPRDYFKPVEAVMDITKNANPSIMDKLGIYRGPVFVALVSYFVLNMMGWSFIASVISMGIIASVIIHFLIHMGSVKESLNTSIDAVVETTKEKLSRRKAQKNLQAEAKAEAKQEEKKE